MLACMAPCFALTDMVLSSSYVWYHQPLGTRIASPMVCSHSKQVLGAKPVRRRSTAITSGPRTKESTTDSLGLLPAQRAAGGVAGGKSLHLRRQQSQRVCR